MARKKQNTKAPAEPQPAEPQQAEPTEDAATPHTSAGVARGAIPIPIKKAAFTPPNSHVKGGGRGPIPGGRSGGMNARSTAHTKGARGR